MKTPGGGWGSGVHKLLAGEYSSVCLPNIPSNTCRAPLSTDFSSAGRCFIENRITEANVRERRPYFQGKCCVLSISSNCGHPWSPLPEPPAPGPQRPGNSRLYCDGILLPFGFRFFRCLSPSAHATCWASPAVVTCAFNRGPRDQSGRRYIGLSVWKVGATVVPSSAYSSAGFRVEVTSTCPSTNTSSVSGASASGQVTSRSQSPPAVQV